MSRSEQQALKHLMPGVAFETVCFALFQFRKGVEEFLGFVFLHHISPGGEPRFLPPGTAGREFS